jgi:hypothetical protein
MYSLKMSGKASTSILLADPTCFLCFKLYYRLHLFSLLKRHSPYFSLRSCALPYFDPLGEVNK